MLHRQFNCTQQELYAVCLHGWDTCSQNLEKLQAFKAKYNGPFVKAKKAELEKVMKMQNQMQRLANAEKTRRDFTNQATACLEMWQKLKLYILEAWPKEDHDMVLRGAGLPFYKEAAKFRWEACTTVLNMANAFILEHKDRLLAGNNMPKGFPDEFSKMVLAFGTELTKYHDSVKTASALTVEKLKACNVLYNDLMNMFADGRMVFKKDPVMLKYFTFESVLQMVSGSGSAGIKGTVSNGKFPAASIEGLELALERSDGYKTANIHLDEEGHFSVNKMAAGTYSLRATAPGYKVFSMEGIVVQTGTHTTVHIVLEPN